MGQYCQSMAERIAIILGHPDPCGGHFGHALAEAYRRGAEEAGLEVRVIPVANIDFPLLRSSDEFERGEVSEPVRQFQETIG